MVMGSLRVWILVFWPRTCVADNDVVAAAIDCEKKDKEEDDSIILSPSTGCTLVNYSTLK
jgi:hypothetical protein